MLASAAALRALLLPVCQLAPLAGLPLGRMLILMLDRFAVALKALGMEGFVIDD